MIALFVTLFLLPGTHELSAPGPVGIPLTGSNFLHLRWKSLKSSGYWNPPSLTLPSTGTYWVSAATRPQVRSFTAAAFNQLIEQGGITMVQEYRRKYKLTNQPAKALSSDYAKTMITVGPPEPIAPVELNLPIEFILRYPQLVQLNFRGKPISDIQISLNGKAIGRTNGAGQLPLPSLTSATRLSATVVRAYPDPTTAPWEFFNATLTLPPLSQRQATIDDRQLPGHELRRRQVIDNRIGDLIASAEATSGSPLEDFLQRSTVSFRKGNRPRRNAVHADLWCPGPRHRPRHMDHPGFRGTVVYIHRPSLDAANRADVYNPAAPLLPQHLPGRLLGAKEISLQVRRVDEVPIRFRHQQRIDFRDARRVVHQRINRAYLAKEPLDLAHLREIGAEDRSAAAQRAHFFRLRSRVPVMDQYPRSLAVQPRNNRPANPPRRPCHEYGLSRQSSECHMPINSMFALPQLHIALLKL